MLMATLPSHHSAIFHANVQPYVQVLLPTRELVTDHIFYKSGNRTRDMLAFRTAFAEQWLLGMTDFQVCQRGSHPLQVFQTSQCMQASESSLCAILDGVYCSAQPKLRTLEKVNY